ncbi:MAG TPA: DUF3617 family protein [Burkholderiales bacterium]|nr:DUF3617 family protein [Burkholderiales bacterium]
MRTLIVAIASSAAVIAVAGAFAADVSPGLWEFTMETRVPSEPGFAPAPFQMTQCLSAQDAREPGRLLAQIANPGATGCDYADRKYSGNSFSFTLQCAGAYGIASRGQVSFTSDTMDGNIDATANVGGSRVEMQNRISARRIGAC